MIKISRHLHTFTPNIDYTQIYSKNRISLLLVPFHLRDDTEAFIWWMMIEEAEASIEHGFYVILSVNTRKTYFSILHYS